MKSFDQTYDQDMWNVLVLRKDGTPPVPVVYWQGNAKNTAYRMAAQAARLAGPGSAITFISRPGETKEKAFTYILKIRNRSAEVTNKVARDKYKMTQPEYDAFTEKSSMLSDAIILERAFLVLERRNIYQQGVNIQVISDAARDLRMKAEEK